jgi:hypothetical protein
MWRLGERTSTPNPSALMVDIKPTARSTGKTGRAPSCWNHVLLPMCRGSYSANPRRSHIAYHPNTYLCAVLALSVDTWRVSESWASAVTYTCKLRRVCPPLAANSALIEGCPQSCAAPMERSRCLSRNCNCCTAAVENDTADSHAVLHSEKAVLLQKRCAKCRFTCYRVRYPTHPPHPASCVFNGQHVHVTWQCLCISHCDAQFHVMYMSAT